MPLRDIEFGHHLLQPAAVGGRGDLARDAAAARRIGHQHAEAPGEREIGGQRRALRAAFLLDHLHQQDLPAADDFLDLVVAQERGGMARSRWSSPFSWSPPPTRFRGRQGVDASPSQVVQIGLVRVGTVVESLRAFDSRARATAALAGGDNGGRSGFAQGSAAGVVGQRRAPARARTARASNGGLRCPRFRRRLGPNVAGAGCASPGLAQRQFQVFFFFLARGHLRPASRSVAAGRRRESR